MKLKNLSKEEREELEKFGANTWFVEYLHKQYSNNPEAVPEQWQKFFNGISSKDGNGKKSSAVSDSLFGKNIQFPQPGENDEAQVIAGSAERILENMTNSLSVPVATSQRSIPVKLLEETGL